MRKRKESEHFAFKAKIDHNKIKMSHIEFDIGILKSEYLQSNLWQDKDPYNNF
jgi:hypothetical protein